MFLIPREQGSEVHYVTEYMSVYLENIIIFTSIHQFNNLYWTCQSNDNLCWICQLNDTLNQPHRITISTLQYKIL